MKMIILLGYLALALISITVYGCQQPCSDTTFTTCCIKGSCGCVQMLGTTDGCDKVPGPGSCAGSACSVIGSTCGIDEYCVEDIGDGTAGCVSIGDPCTSCFALGLLTKLCEDGSCRGSCGCQWGLNEQGEVECQNNAVLPLGCPGEICGSVETGECGGCRALCGLCPDGKTQWGCCGDCYISYDADGNQLCTGFKPKTCEDCLENEEYNACGSSCPTVCGDTEPKICTADCVAGCFCKRGFVLDQEDGKCIPVEDCACPRRCTGGFDGCNNCGCDGLGSTTICTTGPCVPGDNVPRCKSCEIGYILNTATNTCDAAKISCGAQSDCDQANGFRCQKDPECREYSDLACADTGRVCVAPRRKDQTECDSESDCDTANGFGCLLGDQGTGRCVKYQSP